MRTCVVRLHRSAATTLNLPAASLSCIHADLRISLREMRAGQRSSRPFQRLEGNQMPALRIDEAFQEVFGFRLLHAERRRTVLHRQAKLMRNVRHGETAFALDSPVAQPSPAAS